MKKIITMSTVASGGINSVVQSYFDDGLFENYDALWIATHAEGSFSKKQWLLVKSYIYYCYLLITNQVSLLHCHSAMRGSFWRKALFSIISRLFNVPVVFHLHGSEFKKFVSEQPLLLQKLIAWIFFKQSIVLVLSQSWFDYISNISPNANVKVLPNYVKLPDISFKDNGQNKKIEVLFLGVIGIRKGVYDLLPAFKVALAEVPNLHLTIGGNGELDKAKAMAASLGIDKQVHFAGWVTGEAKLKLLAKADIYVLPSYNEGLPISILEAMSWEIPVISTKVGGIPELIKHKNNGLLIDAGDVDSLADSIVMLANQSQLRLSLGQAGRAKIEKKHSDIVNLEKLKSIYSGMMNN